MKMLLMKSVLKNCKETSILIAIAEINPTLAAKLDEQYGFVTAEDVQPMIDIFPNMDVVVRTDMGRFKCTISELRSNLDEVRKGRGRTGGDLRDVYIPIDR